MESKAFKISNSIRIVTLDFFIACRISSVTVVSSFCSLTTTIACLPRVEQFVSLKKT